MFMPEEVEAQLAAIEQAQSDKTTDDFDEEDPFRESPAEAAERGHTHRRPGELENAAFVHPKRTARDTVRFRAGTVPQPS